MCSMICRQEMSVSGQPSRDEVFAQTPARPAHLQNIDVNARCDVTSDSRYCEDFRPCVSKGTCVSVASTKRRKRRRTLGRAYIQAERSDMACRAHEGSKTMLLLHASFPHGLAPPHSISTIPAPPLCFAPSNA